MIRLEQVSKVYKGGQKGLLKLNLHIKEGEMVFLTGHSGAGKSTLLKLASLLERPTTGQIWLDGEDVSRVSKSRIPSLRRKMGLIFQEHRLLMDRTVFENIALPLVIDGYSYNDINRRVMAALDKVGLHDKARCLPRQLSGGEQQRVGIARAVINRPKVLIADEPTGNLDPALSAEIMGLFAQFNRVGVTVIVATHDLGLIARMPYRTINLKQGRLQGAHE